VSEKSDHTCAVCDFKCARGKLVEAWSVQVRIAGRWLCDVVGASCASAVIRMSVH
jgi:hypothetical protein